MADLRGAWCCDLRVHRRNRPSWPSGLGEVGTGRLLQAGEVLKLELETGMRAENPEEERPGTQELTCIQLLIHQGGFRGR